MDYRIDYGNGQVSRTFHTYPEARAELRATATTLYSELFRIRRYDGGGEWVSIGKAGRLATLEHEGIAAEAPHLR